MLNIRYKDNNNKKEAITPNEKYDAFIHTLFPTSNTPKVTSETTTWDWPDLNENEIKRAISSSSSKKAPGNDRISFAILKQAYTIAPTILDSLYKACFRIGYHLRA